MVIGHDNIFNIAQTEDPQKTKRLRKESKNSPALMIGEYSKVEMIRLKRIYRILEKLE